MAGGDRSPVDWGSGRFESLHAQRLAVRDCVLGVLRRKADAGKLLGVKGVHLDRALAEWRDIDSSPTMPAAYRYSGVVWGGLDLASLPPASRRRAMSRIVVPSGLWGLVAADDAIPAYRLKMGARVGRLGLLSSWWRPAVSAALAHRAGRGAVIDLLPQEHAAAIDATVLRPGALVRVDIVDDGPDGRRSVGHAGKQIKGRLARAMVNADARTADDIAALDVDGLSLVGLEVGVTTLITFRRRT
jgi:uncharacterized protein